MMGLLLLLIGYVVSIFVVGEQKFLIFMGLDQLLGFRLSDEINIPKSQIRISSNTS